jgi:hypothetical protein
MPEPEKTAGLSQIIDDRINAIDRHLSNNGIESYDPYDGLLSPLARLLSASQLLSRVWLQANRYSPINIRPALGIPKMLHTKLVSDLASGYSLLSHLTGDKKWSEAADRYFRLLIQRATVTPGGLGWGLNFPYVTRFVSADSTEPNIFQTINAVQAFLDGVKYLGRSEFLEYADKGFGFLRQDLGYMESSGVICWNYWKGMQTPIYNVNGLMTGLTAQLWQATGDEGHRILSVRTMGFLLSGQRPDGSWPYAAGGKAAFTDGFHTGYIIEGLSRAGAAGAVKLGIEYDGAVRYYLNNFFSGEGLPKYYPDSVYPLDGQNVAQAWQTLSFLVTDGRADKDLLVRCFEASDKRLWDRKGYYYHRRTRLGCSKTPMHRWVTGPMFLALVRIKAATSGKDIRP